MARSKTYRIDISPISWQRAKLKGGKFFDNQVKQKMCFGLYVQKQHGNEPVFSKPISMDITFFMAQPYSKRKAYYHASFPDLDNLCKFLLDSMKDVVISDDRIICSLSAKKIYSAEPRTEFTITEVEAYEKGD